MSAEPPATRRILRRIRLLPYQMQVMRSRAPYLMVPAGLGSGKSFIAAEKALRLAFENAGPEVLHLAGLCVEPTYKQVTRIMVPALRSALHRWGIEENGKGPSGYRYFKNDQMIVVRFGPGRTFTIYLASAERPDTLVGPNLCFVIFDEAGYVDPLAWNNAMPRVRHPQAKLLQFMGVGTPEGFGAFYEFAQGNPKTGTELVRACTLDNRHLQPTPEAYVASQLSHFSDQEREAYVRGMFVSRGGQVYDAWDDDRHLRPFEGTFEDAELVMGADFGYRRTVFVLGVVVRVPGSWRGDLVERLHVLGEVEVGRQGTLNAIPLVRDAWEALVARYDIEPEPWSRIAPRITVFADSTKWQNTDRQILKKEGMFVHEHGRNPLVMDRVYSVNKRLMDDLIYVDPEGAPYVAHCLRNQGYGSDGFPEKPSDDGSGAPAVDHGCLAAGTLVTTARGPVPIELVYAGDQVLTRKGYRTVTASHRTKVDAETVIVEAGDARVVATPDHPFFTLERGWVPAASLMPSDTLLACPKASSSTESSSAATPTPRADPIGSTTPPEAPTAPAGLGDSTRRSGSTPTGPSPTATSSTTSTRTPSTTPPRTSPASPTRSTAASTPASASSPRRSSAKTKPEPGTGAPRVAPGTASKLAAPTPPASRASTSARTAEPATRPPRVGETSASAPETARQPPGAPPASTTRTAPARTAGMLSASTATPESAAAGPRVRRVSAGPIVDVYDLTVDEEPEFFAEGVLVHNSDALGYPVFGKWPIEAPRGNLTSRRYH